MTHRLATRGVRRRVTMRAVRASLGIAVAALLIAGLSACSAGRSLAGGGSSTASSPARDMAQTEGSKGGSAPGAPPAASAGANGAPGGVVVDSTLPPAEAPRQIVRNGSVDLEVRSVTESFTSVQQIAAGVGGMVVGSSFSGRAAEQNATLTLRVPSARFDETIGKLRDVAVEVRTIDTGSKDVTDEYTDTQATIANLRAVESQYVTLLGRASTIGEVLQVQDRLNQVRLQIDRTEARRQSLASQAAMSTITVSLRPVAAPSKIVPDGGGVWASARAAWTASLATLTTLATALVVIVVYGWWIILAGSVVGAVLLVRHRRRLVTPSIEAA